MTYEQAAYCVGQDYKEMPQEAERERCFLLLKQKYRSRKQRTEQGGKTVQFIESKATYSRVKWHTRRP